MRSCWKLGSKHKTMLSLGERDGEESIGRNLRRFLWRGLDRDMDRPKRRKRLETMTLVWKKTYCVGKGGKRGGSKGRRRVP